MTCSVVFCSSRSTKGGKKVPDLSFHDFPKCPEVRSEWIKAVRRENWEPTKYSRICSKHFDASCFMTGMKIKKLKSDAVPTIFKEYPVYFQAAKIIIKPPPQREQNQNASPKKLMKIQESGEETEDLLTIPRRTEIVFRLLAQSRRVATNRLQAIRRLKENNRRLLRKVDTLSKVISHLKSNNNRVP